MAVAAPSVILAVLLGKREVEDSVPARWRTGVEAFLSLAVAGLAMTALPEIDRRFFDDGYPRPAVWFAARKMPKAVAAPAIVLFRFAPGDDFHDEPVYNVDVVNPDNAPIIRAHNLGVDRDRELFAYYAARQPDRSVYLYDRASRSLVRLGNVVELAQRFPATQPAVARPAQWRGPSSSGPR
jgi:hypothetical protein